MTRADPRAWVRAALVGALATACGEGPVGPPIEVVRVERDLLAEPGAWKVVRGRAEAPPRVEILCPNVSSEADGADMPALVLAPPGEVVLEVPAEATPAWLVARAGVDQFAYRNLAPAYPRVRIAFEVRLDGRQVAREVIELEHGQHARNAWVDLGGRDGIPLTGAARVQLLTEALGPDGAPVELPRAFNAGFGGLRLERRFEQERARSSPEQPSLVLVVMDTLRADRLSAYGYERPTSPHLERLAARGVRFDACQSTASWTWPATASILTGLTPMEHGLVGEGSSFLPEAGETLAESLQRAGFTTAAWSGNPIVSIARNFDQGFERFTSAPGQFQKTGVFFEEVRAFLRATAGRRFFLYLHLTEPHAPLHALEEGARQLAGDVPPGFLAKAEGLGHATSKGQAFGPDGSLRLEGIVTPEERAWVGQLYDACVWSGDHWLGELLGELAALGLEDETVVAFTSDHGEELLERGFLGHGQSLRAELVRVPLVLAGPGVPRGRPQRALTSVRTIAPLLAGLAGVPFGGSETALRALQQDLPAEDTVLFTTTKGFWKGRSNVRVLGLSDGRWKLDLAPEGGPWGTREPGPDGDVELYRLDRDPLEREDVAASHPEEVARLRQRLLERIEELEARRIGVDVPAGEATRRMLEALGYGGGGH